MNSKGLIGKKWVVVLPLLFCLQTEGNGAQAASLLTPPVANGSFPVDAGMLNVKDFGAVGDGVHDDTAAFNAAFYASSDPLFADRSVVAGFFHNKMVYAPAGTYLVSDTLAKRYSSVGNSITANGKTSYFLYNSGLVLVGAGIGVTTIQLKPSAAGFQSASAPKAVIFTSAKGYAQYPSGGGEDGEGDDAWSNFVENLTVNVGTTNPGAIGIDYLANNVGAIRNVEVTGNGAIGISMVRMWNGPCLLDHVTINGFEVGLDVGQNTFSIAVDYLKLTGQSKIALRNDGNIIGMHHLQIATLGNATEQAIVNENAAGMIVVDQGTIDARDTTGVSNGGVAAVNSGYLSLRNINLFGYSSFLSQSKVVRGSVVDGLYDASAFVSAATPSWGGLQGEPVANVFTYAAEPWASVVAFGAVGDGVTDSTAAFSAAFNSGAGTVYIPFGSYAINQNIVVPSTVHHIVGMFSTIIPAPIARSKTFLSTAGMFKTQNNLRPLLIENLFFYATTSAQLGVEDMGSEPMMLRDIATLGVSFQRDASGGPLHIQDMGDGFKLTLLGTAPVTTSQLDSEGGGIRGGVAGPRVFNEGAPLYILGGKAEGDNTYVANSAGAITDIIGLFHSPDQAATLPMFTNINSTIQFTGAEYCVPQHCAPYYASATNTTLSAPAIYTDVLVNTIGTKETTLLNSSLPLRPVLSGTQLGGFFLLQIEGLN